MKANDIRKELERVAHSDAQSGREAIAKVTALRTLERLNRGDEETDERVKRLFDETRDPEERVREDDWYPRSGDDEADAVMRELDQWDTVRHRRELFLTLAETQPQFT